MAKTAILFVALAGMSMLPLTTASPPDVTFLCDKLPEVCTNMCWAVRCANPTFPQTLTWDDPDEDTQNKRRDAAGCNRSRNKCGTKQSGVGHRGPPNISCDEYPFASTSESKFPNGNQVSRCVPTTENSRQGNALMQAYKKFRAAGYKTHSLKIAFGNPGSAGVNYCLNQACKNDGFEVQNKKLSKREETPDFKFYQTRSGMIVGSFEETDLPANFTREVGETEVLGADFETWIEAIDLLEIQLVTDTLLHEVSINGTRI